MKLIPVTKNYLWGGNKLREFYGKTSKDDIIAESWEFSVHADGESQTEKGSFKEYLQKNPTALFENGGEFPVLIKYIDALDNLSVQVHPDNEYALRVENDNGKTETWYILEAEQGAGIYCGFKKDTDKAEFLKSVELGTATDYLNFIPVKKGDCFLIKAGTVHAIGKGCLILEIQQNSNTTYRVYDFNRVGADGKKRQLHVDEAMDVINFSAFKDVTGGSDYQQIEGGKIRLLTSCEYFTVKELILNGEYKDLNKNSFIAVCVVEGNGFVNGESAKKGDSFFIDRNKQLAISGNLTAVLTTKE